MAKYKTFEEAAQELQKKRTRTPRRDTSLHRSRFVEDGEGLQIIRASDAKKRESDDAPGS